MLKAKYTFKKQVISLFLISLMVLASSTTRPVKAEDNSPTPYNSEIASRLVTRCDLIKDYLSKTVRINELSTRQNKVRGWEYMLRRLSNLQEGYSKFGVDYNELSSEMASLRRQLDQFKVDFEAYDAEFQSLLGVSCKDSPQEFWRQLETLRSFRSGIALSSENYKNSLMGVVVKESNKW